MPVETGDPRSTFFVGGHSWSDTQERAPRAFFVALRTVALTSFWPVGAAGAHHNCPTRRVAGRKRILAGHVNTILAWARYGQRPRGGVGCPHDVVLLLGGFPSLPDIRWNRHGGHPRHETSAWP